MKHLHSTKGIVAIELTLLLLLLLIFYNFFSALWSILIFFLFIGFNLVLLIKGVLRWNKCFWAALTSLFFMGILFPGLIALPKNQAMTLGKGSRIMSYNLNYLRSVLVAEENDESYSFEQFIQFMNQQSPIDILCVQETSSASYVPIAQQLNYPHYFGRKGTMIFLREPFLEKGFIDFGEETDNSCTWATVLLNRNLYRIYNAHLESYNFARLLRETKQQSGLFKQWKSFTQEVNRIEQLRLQQSQKIAQHLSDSPYPVILCGDFNDLPISPVYQFFSQNLNDAFRKNGTGFGQTFRNILGLRIDYFFTSPTINTVNYQRIKADFSDHYPILLEAEL